jgi:hypothetical protein
VVETNVSLSTMMALNDLATLPQRLLMVKLGASDLIADGHELFQIGYLVD